MRLRSRAPSSGKSASSVRAVTGPTPGTERRRSSFSRQTGLFLSRSLMSWSSDSSCFRSHSMVFLDALDGGGGTRAARDGEAGQSIAFGGQHRDQLPATQEKCLELEALLVRDRLRLRFGRGAKVREHPRVDRVGLGEDAKRLREVAHLPWIDHGRGDLAASEQKYNFQLETPGRFEHDQHRRRLWMRASASSCPSSLLRTRNSVCPSSVAMSRWSLETSMPMYGLVTVTSQGCLRDLPPETRPCTGIRALFRLWQPFGFDGSRSSARRSLLPVGLEEPGKDRSAVWGIFVPRLVRGGICKGRRKGENLSSFPPSLIPSLCSSSLRGSLANSADACRRGCRGSSSCSRECRRPGSTDPGRCTCRRSGPSRRTSSPATTGCSRGTSS